MKFNGKAGIVPLCLITPLLMQSSCKKNSDTDWQDSELQSLANSMAPVTHPPENILARVIVAERDSALKTLNFIAAQINSAEEKNPKSFLNQIRRMFNPEHMSTLSYKDALDRVRAEGSGAHGAARNLRQPQDSLYHALWSRIADAAGVVGFSRSSKHMKHYLGNSGQIIRYTADETTSILNESSRKDSRRDSQFEIDFFASDLQRRLKMRGLTLARSEAEMLAGMSNSEISFYLARSRIKNSLAEMVQQNKVSNAADLLKIAASIKNKNFPSKSPAKSGAWTEYRPIGKYYGISASEPQTDLYFSLGTYTSIYSATPIDMQNEGNLIKLRFAQSVSLFDKYNWDDGKFVVLFSGWCWKINSDHCSHIESLTSLTVADKSIGRLHKLGLAREFEIQGQTRVTTVWDAIQFDDLKNEQKEKVRATLDNILSEQLTPIELIPD